MSENTNVSLIGVNDSEMDMGNFGFPNRSITYSEDDSNSDMPNCLEENSESDISSMCYEDSESDMSSVSYEDTDTSSDDHATFDSVIRVPTKYHACYNISSDVVSNIETDLNFSELISLIFLLFDDINYATQVIRSMIATGSENLSNGKLSEWARSSPKHWKYKLFEALAIIQNYKVLMKFGLCKEDINVMHDAPTYINRLKKVLYSSLCEVLTREQAEELIKRVRSDVTFEDDITLDTDPKFIEFHILFWISQDYIKIESEPYLENLTKHLKATNFIHVFDKINTELVAIRTENRLKKSEETKIKHLDDEEECYEIKDPNNPGLVVVINNANFTENVEKREQYKSRLPSSPLADRLGSSIDVQNIKKTFENLKYEVVVRNDITHDKLVDEVYEAVKKNFKVSHHSVLVLCILSHGDKGLVFGANSIPLRKKDIINSVTGSSRLIDVLAGIPKIIIIQACQGKQVLYVEPEADLLVPDGPSIRPDSPVVPDGNIKVDGLGSYDPRDKVVCMATIKGFVALRNEAKGTPYIQELCRCIEKHHAEKHFLDIMTKVQKHLTNEKCIVKQVNKKRPVCMIPEIKSNLSKPLYLSRKQPTSRYKHNANPLL